MLLIHLGLIKLHHLLYPPFLTGSDMLVFFSNPRFMERQVRYLALLCFFFFYTTLSDFEPNIWCSARFHSLVLHFSCYTLMTYFMLSVILLCVFMILSMIIRHLICENSWLENFNLTLKTTVGWDRKWLVGVSWFHLTYLIAISAIDKKMDWSPI